MHTHDHDHDHPHETLPDAPETTGYHERLETAVRELLIEKGILTAEQVRAAVEDIEDRTPALGARIVARAWTDPAFKARLMADAPAAARELGIDVGATHLVVVENTPQVHNLIVCTLCSCYPRAVLGLSPAWYKSAGYRSRAVREPRSVLAEFGTEIPEDVTVRVHDSTAELRYLVLPERPPDTEHLDETQLVALVGRDAMIGVARARSPDS
jgi:nitrile hydratase subunit alpha